MISAAAWFVLSRTELGNWIYATGGNEEAARANGVPTNKVKVSLFMFTAFCATIFAATQVFDTNTADAAKGNLKELEAIAASVVGGVILSGGFGSIRRRHLRGGHLRARTELGVLYPRGSTDRITGCSWARFC